MPYIKKMVRALIKDSDTIIINQIKSSGELNYAVTEIIAAYFKNNGENYNAINDIMGALEGAKLEFYRRVAIPYENKKIKENGDVY